MYILMVHVESPYTCLYHSRALPADEERVRDLLAMQPRDTIVPDRPPPPHPRLEVMEEEESCLCVCGSLNGVGLAVGGGKTVIGLRYTRHSCIC